MIQKRHKLLISWLKYLVKSQPKNKDEYLRVYFDEFEESNYEELKIPIH